MSKDMKVIFSRKDKRLFVLNVVLLYLFFPVGRVQGPTEELKRQQDSCSRVAAGFDKNDNMGSRPESTGQAAGVTLALAPAPALSESAAAWPRPGPGRSYDSYHGHRG